MQWIWGDPGYRNENKSQNTKQLGRLYSILGSTSTKKVLGQLVFLDSVDWSNWGQSDSKYYGGSYGQQRYAKALKLNLAKKVEDVYNENLEHFTEGHLKI